MSVIKEINNPEDFLKEVSCIEDYSVPKKNRESYYLFMGLPDANDKIITSMEKYCGTKQRQLEKNILRNFSKYASIIDNPYLFNTEWQQMVIGEHHDLPTRLLDWTRSPLVALHNAISGVASPDFEKKDSVVWAIDVNEINRLLPREYQKVLLRENSYVFTIKSLEGIAKDLDRYDKDMTNKSVAIIEPPSIDKRIVNRYSFFVVVPSEIEDFCAFLEKNTRKTVKYIINKSIKWHTRDMLDTMNINERILSPGYDGLCEWLARHYFSR